MNMIFHICICFLALGHQPADKIVTSNIRPCFKLLPSVADIISGLSGGILRDSLHELVCTERMMRSEFCTLMLMSLDPVMDGGARNAKRTDISSAAHD